MGEKARHPVDSDSTVLSFETDETRAHERKEERWGNATGIPGESSLATEFLLGSLKEEALKIQESGIKVREGRRKVKNRTQVDRRRTIGAYEIGGRSDPSNPLRSKRRSGAHLTRLIEWTPVDYRIDLACPGISRALESLIMSLSIPRPRATANRRLTLWICE